MTTSQLKEILKSNILTISVPDNEVSDIWSDYVQAGAHILLAPPCVFADDEEADILDQLFEAAEDHAFVAGQITAPDPAEAFDYDSFYNDVLNRAGWLYDMGASMIFLTGFSDILSAKCAIYAIREASLDIPICFGITMKDDGEMIKKSLSLLIAMQALDICAFGCTNMDIEDSLELLSELQSFTTVPLFVIAAPGSYLEPELYSDYITSFTNHKCAMVGLLNSSPAYTAAATKECWQLAPLKPDFPVLNAVCSQNESLFLDFTGKIVSKNKQLLEISTEKQEEVEQALAIFNKPGAMPVCFCIKDIDVLEYTISHYAGRPAVRSDEYGEITAKEFGAFILAEKKAESK